MAPVKTLVLYPWEDRGTPRPETLAPRPGARPWRCRPCAGRFSAAGSMRARYLRHGVRLRRVWLAARACSSRRPWRCRAAFWICA